MISRHHASATGAPSVRAACFQSETALPAPALFAATKKCGNLSAPACEQVVGNIALKAIF
jgi:hypothetical protein